MNAFTFPQPGERRNPSAIPVPEPVLKALLEIAEASAESGGAPSEKLWLNATTLVRPTDDIARKIGYTIIRLLDRRSYPWKVTIEVTAS